MQTYVTTVVQFFQKLNPGNHALIGTYSTCLDHSGGLLKVMNTQLVKIVHIMIMLNNVRKVKETTSSELERKT